MLSDIQAMIIDYKKKAQYNNLVSGLDGTSINTEQVHQHLLLQQKKSIAGNLMRELERTNNDSRTKRSLSRSMSVSREVPRPESKFTKRSSRGSLSISPTSRSSHSSNKRSFKAKAVKKSSGRQIRRKKSSASRSA